MINLIKTIAPKDHKLQYKLIWIMVGLIIITALSIAFPMGYAFLVARQNVSRLYTQQALNKTASQLTKFIEPIYSSLSMIRSWGLSDTFTLDQPTQLYKLVYPVLDEMTCASTLAIANTKGDYYILTKDSNHWISCSSAINECNTLYKNASLQSRSWFSNTLIYAKQDQVRWSAPYNFINQHKGITATLAWHDSNDFSTVVAVDILDSEFKNATTAIMADNYGHIFSTLGDNLAKQLDNRLPLTDDLSANLMSNTLVRFHSSTNFTSQIFRVPFEGKIWWAGAKELQFRHGKYWIYTILPSTSLHDEINHKRYSYIIILVVIIIIAITSIVILLRAYSRSLSQLSKMRKIIENSETSLRELIDSGESDELEFKSTLRLNLATGKSGHEIEYASLKTIVAFINTNGGTLLVGVQDDGSILGIDSDNFDNEDKFLLHFNNLLNQHIGLENSAYINFELRSIENKKILVIEVEPSKAPVFLKTGKQEDFLIRVGPSSRKLSNSQTVDYTQKKH